MGGCISQLEQASNDAGLPARNDYELVRFPSNGAHAARVMTCTVTWRSVHPSLCAGRALQQGA